MWTGAPWAPGKRALAVTALDRKSTRLNSKSRLHLVCRLLLEKKKTKGPKKMDPQETEEYVVPNLSEQTLLTNQCACWSHISDCPTAKTNTLTRNTRP